ncbi:M20 family metallopeptidase [Corynebacterium diphtheriae]|uniref:M20 family metallopeptidase n=1 Tax=Corynebacterium diphtheriae TaxID=1717 RepID=UPI00086BDE24|nr:M20 family metallopeptidase [Corynebacterium diphtheriae]MBG9336240.1 M20 family metallopeptidase [Corynebacterium diphtheriae bv. gravis]ODS16638.1 peptidase M20 [Corynebacterium diphtheriae]ONF67597.1 peptidase M20 [Corynebacterium diphtheriae]RLP13473.1 M20 family peptidase [Corynebacterium diphtheriae]CAB0931999.1 amidohydrolase [Corynebacterium diphtheriae]
MCDMHEPTPPNPAFTQHLAAETQIAKETMRYHEPTAEGAPKELCDRLKELVDAHSDTIIGLSQYLHANPETAFEEHGSVKRIAEILKEHDLDVEVGVYGVETAFESHLVNRDGPTIAILSEYDALPGIGHACGHNVMAATGLGAYLALAALVRENPDAFKGTVKYIGTPAEEGSSGKEVMARGGAFKPEDMDACIMVHSYGYDLADQVWFGRRVLNVTFHGAAAHASSQPFMGRNALDAAAMTYQGLAVLRQQVPPSDRIHAIITKGGTRQSIITEEAEMKFYVRSKYPDTLKDLSRRVENVVKGAAQMTDCGVDIEWDYSPATLGVRANDQLVSRWVEAQRRRGRDPLPRGVVSEILAASTDFGNVSYRVPGIHPLIKVANEDQALHTREFEASVGTEKGDRGAVDGAYGLAQVALDFLTDADLRKAVKDEFEAAGGSIDVEHYFD